MLPTGDFIVDCVTQRPQDKTTTRNQTNQHSNHQPDHVTVTTNSNITTTRIATLVSNSHPGLVAP